MQQTIELGLIGAGRWGKNIIRTVNEIPNANLIAIASKNPESKNLVSNDCIVTRNWHDLLCIDKIDGIIIATPPDTHAKYILSTVDAGIPVMVEKPLTMDLEEAKNVKKSAEESNIPVLIDHIHILSPAYQALKSILNKYGSIKHITSIGGNYGPFNNTSPLWDWGVHDVSLCIDMLGLDIKLCNVKLLDTNEGETNQGEIIRLNMVSKDNIEGELTFGNIMRNKTRLLTVECQSAKIILDDVRKKLSVTSDKKTYDKVFPSISPLKNALNIFISGIRNKEYKSFGLDIGVRSVEILSEAYTQLYST